MCVFAFFSIYFFLANKFSVIKIHNQIDAIAEKEAVNEMKNDRDREREREKWNVCARKIEMSKKLKWYKNEVDTFANFSQNSLRAQRMEDV